MKVVAEDKDEAEAEDEAEDEDESDRRLQAATGFAIELTVPDDADEPTVAALALDEERRVDSVTKMDVGMRLGCEHRARRSGERAEIRVGLGLADFEVEAKDDAQWRGPRLCGNQFYGPFGT